MSTGATSVLNATAPPEDKVRAAHRNAACAGCPGWKRGLDLFVVILTAPLWLPLMILIAVGIKIVSPGCVFFFQERIGRHGRVFKLFKFRSMKLNVETVSHERYCDNLIQEDRPMVKLDSTGDPRIIPLGRLLRASGLDELPQVFNVLRGEMSLVGPRPCTAQEYVRYEPSQRERFNVMPGLTGYWQVNGKNKTTFKEMVAMDIHYTHTLSLGLDLSIMLRTIPTLVGQIREMRMARRQAA
jgi:lipopolysaccharide/colanic/teichoic acid biosynthesis glycosyltransferase